jgi:hypothetical protein
MAEQTDTTYPHPPPDPPDPMTVESLPAIHSRPCRGHEPGWTEFSTFDEMDVNPMHEESSRPDPDPIPKYRPRTPGLDPNWGDPCSSHAEYLENHARYIANHPWSKPVKQWPTIAERITEEMLEVSTTSLQDLSVTQPIPVPLSVTQIIPDDH